MAEFSVVGEGLPKPKEVPPKPCECCGRTMKDGLRRFCFWCQRQHNEGRQCTHGSKVESKTHCSECGGTLVVNRWRILICAACGEAEAIFP